MKKTVLTAFCALFAMAGLHSCLDFDMPTDSFTGGDVDLDPIVYRGKADSIDYRGRICRGTIAVEPVFRANADCSILFARW